jgi:8-oxo-dGTP pyrophosphatase MutT (NUDIX family)
MECVNCRKHGHTFRDCKEPTSSYGVVAVRFTAPKTPEYLLIRRRDSLGYVDFLRGKYSLSNRPYIETLLQSMSKEELNRLTSQPFDELWSRLWNYQNTRQFRLEHESAKRIFDTFRTTGDISGKTLQRYITEVTTKWAEPEWGFPKGRRSPHESELTCALREFTEETGVAAKCVRILEHSPQLEEYTGTNNIRYKHVYYIASCNEEVEVHVGNRVQTREVGDIGWFSYENAMAVIRSSNPEKRDLLERIHQILTK